MNALITLTRREVADRRPLLLGTLAAAVLALLARFTPGVRPVLAQEIHEAMATIFTLTFPTALALGLGASVIGEDLAERRLGFYFSRPVPAWAIWASKVLAAVVLTLSAWVFFAIPVFLLREQSSDLPLFRSGWTLLWMTALVALIFVTQAAAGAYRARDGLFAFDLAAFAVIVAAGTVLGWWLFDSGAPDTLRYLVPPLMAMVVLASAAAGALQVVTGRTDPRRGHLALSICLWGSLGLAVSIAGAFSTWVLSVRPDQTGVGLNGVQATASASYVAFAAGRERAGYRPFFLLDVASGRSERLSSRRFGGLAFSADGRRAAWIELGSPTTLTLAHLDEPGTSRRRSTLNLFLDDMAHLVCLAPDGRRAVVANMSRFAVVDTDSGREEAAASTEGVGGLASPVSSCAFHGGTVVRLFGVHPRSGAPMVVSDFDFRTGHVAAGPKPEGEWLQRVHDGLAVISGREGALEIVEGQRVLRLSPGEPGRVVDSVDVLANGTTLALVRIGAESRVLGWNADGAKTVDVPAPPGPATLGGESQPGVVMIGQRRWPAGTPRTLFVDLTSGAVAREEPGLMPARAWGAAQPRPGSPASHLFVGANGELLRLDPATGRREAVLVPAPPGGID